MHRSPMEYEIVDDNSPAPAQPQTVNHLLENARYVAKVPLFGKRRLIIATHWKRSLSQSIPVSSLLRELRKQFNPLLLLGLALTGVLCAESVRAQLIVPNNDGTGTIVTPNSNQLNISGGKLSGDGANLFHSFSQFGLNQNQVANFLSNPSIQNILARVNGGNPSVIDGLIQVTGGNSNLFLMNPSGILFGANASLNVPASFTATTANGIGFSHGNWFGAIDTNHYANLTGNPDSFAFTMSQPGAIVNAGNLNVGQGNLTLLGGTVASTEQLSAPAGQILVSTIPGQNLVRLSQAGSLLSLDIQPINNSPISAISSIATLPQLLTGGNVSNATGLAVNANGTVELTGSGIQVENGDVVAKTVTAQNATLSADRNLTLVESQLQTTENLTLLAKDTVRVRDSVAAPFLARSNGDSLIQGNRGIDILALNHLSQTPFVSGGNLSLVSDGVISGDAHFASGGSFSLKNLSGGAGKFVSLYDPIISANGDVTFGDYTGASLKVEATGTISGGNITITSPDTSLTGSDPDIPILSSSPSLILRAGLPTLQNPPNVPSLPPANFTSTGGPSGGSVNVGNLQTTSSNPGPVIISATGGDITTGSINTSTDGSSDLGGNVNLTASGNITVNGDINSSAANVEGTGTGGEISLTAGGDIATNAINSSVVDALSGGTGGNITLNAGGNITSTGEVTASASSFDSTQGGNISLTATTGSISTQAISSTSSAYSNATSGTLNLTSGGDISTGALNTTAVAGEGSSTIGGAVTLTAGRNLIFDSIDTSGSEALGSNIGGNVRLLASKGTVQGIGFTSAHPDSTIYTQSSDASGFVKVEHDGGPTNVSFFIGDASVNGTAGKITTSGVTLSPPALFPLVGTATLGNPAVDGVSITFNNTAPTLTANSVLSGTHPNQPITFTVADLAPLVNDVDGDITSIKITAIAPGAILKIDGVEVQPGTTLPFNFRSTSTLEYTPPPNATGQVNAFTIVASDNVSESTPVEITANIGQLPAPPEPITPVQEPEPNKPNPDVDDSFESDSEVDDMSDESHTPQSLLDVDPFVSEIEESVTNTFEEYLEETAEVKELPDVRNDLGTVGQATGVKPALIYAMFVPPDLASAKESDASRKNKDNDQLELFIVTASGNPIRRRILGTTRANVVKVAHEFQQEVSDRRKVKTNSYLSSAQQLYQWLVAPIEADLKARQIQNLAFITDAGLRSIPFAALHDQKGFLIERYSIGLMPSISLTDTRYKDIKSAQVLAMGASKFDQQNPLPAVPLEINTISKLWRGRAFLNESFTLQNLKTQRSQQPYGIIHLATHAEFQPGSLKNSYIQLSDTKLQLDQIRQLGWHNPPVELLVLSACRTALGDQNAELGFAGLAVKSGVKSALASLWYVSDDGTLDLMSTFYQQLSKKPIKAEALRQAQLMMLKGQTAPSNQLEQKNFSHPYYWSSFTMIGSPW